MITLNKMGGKNRRNRCEFCGLSTDNKPVNKDIPNGSSYYEIDTNKEYLFDEENLRWVIQ